MYPRAEIDVRVNGSIAIGINTASEEFLRHVADGKKIDMTQLDQVIREVTKCIERPLTVTHEPTRTSSGREVSVTKYVVAAKTFTY